MSLNSRTDCVTEKQAAQQLGYTQVTWDNDSGKEPQPASSSKAWAELTDVERNAAVALGYSQLSWDYPWPPAADTHFAKLTSIKRAAAIELGYDATSWDNESGKEPQPAAGRYPT